MSLRDTAQRGVDFASFAAMIRRRMDSPVAPDAPSQDSFFGTAWIAAWGAGLRASESYRRAAANWEGALVVGVDADPERGFPSARLAVLDLWHGDCRGAREASAADLATARYAIRGAPAVWRQVLDGKLDPLWALMTRKLVLERGNMAQLTPFAAAAKELVAVAMRLPTCFPEGWRS